MHINIVIVTLNMAVLALYIVHDNSERDGNGMGNMDYSLRACARLPLLFAQLAPRSIFEFTGHRRTQHLVDGIVISAFLPLLVSILIAVAYVIGSWCTQIWVSSREP